MKCPRCGTDHDLPSKEWPLSGLLCSWRAERPDEWIMDEFLSKSLAIEKRCEEAERELKYIDETLARRPALDGMDSRVAKIRYAIDCARMKDKFEAENALLRKRLEPIEVAWNDRSKYTVLEYVDVMYEAIEKSMALKEPTESNGK